MAVDEPGRHERATRIGVRDVLRQLRGQILARTHPGDTVAGERDGCKSHGIYRIEGALRTIKAGKVRPDALPRILPSDGSAIVRVDADGGFANAAFELGVPALVKLSERYGIASLVINNCTHFSALWPEIEALIENRLAGLAMCPSYATVAPAGGGSSLSVRQALFRDAASRIGGLITFVNDGGATIDSLEIRSIKLHVGAGGYSVNLPMPQTLPAIGPGEVNSLAVQFPAVGTPGQTAEIRIRARLNGKEIHLDIPVVLPN